MILKLTIRLGNDRMQTDEDIASALEGVANRFRAKGYVETTKRIWLDEITRGIQDSNGQTIGDWSLIDEVIPTINGREVTWAEVTTEDLRATFKNYPNCPEAKPAKEEFERRCGKL